MIKAVLFDLDGTFYDYSSADKTGYARVEAYALEHFDMGKETFRAGFDKAMTQTAISLGANVAPLHDRYLRFQILLENAALPVIPHVWDMTQLYWNTFLDAMVPSPGIMECLSSLRQAGYIIGVGTNMMLDYQLKKIERLGLASDIDFLVSSEEVNSEKPEKKLFLHCAAKANCHPSECLYVGDNLTHDVEGAENAGMKAVWFQPDPDKASLHSDILSISHFNQLLPLLEQLGQASNHQANGETETAHLTSASQ